MDAPAHLKCVKYDALTDKWYAMDSMIHPYITELSTAEQWRHHTKGTIRVLMQGPTPMYDEMAVPQEHRPRQTTGDTGVVDVDAQHPYDIQQALQLSRAPVRRLQPAETRTTRKGAGTTVSEGQSSK